MGKVKRISGTGARDSDNIWTGQVKIETRGLPESPITDVRVNKKTRLGDWRSREFWVILMFIVLEIQAESLSHSKECQQLDLNLEDWGIVYDK